MAVKRLSSYRTALRGIVTACNHFEKNPRPIHRLVAASCRAAVAGTVFALLTLSCSKQEAQGKRPGPGGSESAPVNVATATTQDVPIELSTFGAVEPIATVEIGARVTGEIVSITFKEGDFVTAGQELFRIDPRAYEVALAQAEANLSRAEAEVNQARSAVTERTVQAKNAQITFERNKSLLELGMVAREAYDQSLTQADTLRAAVSADEAAVVSGQEAVRAAQTAVDAAKLSLNYCTILAPMAGRTGSLMMHQGDLVRQNDVTPLVVITQTKPTYVSFTVPEKHLASIRELFTDSTLAVHASIPERDMVPVRGRLTFVDSSVDPGTRTIRLKATFDNEDELLWPGQYVNVTLNLGMIENALVIPSRAVQPGQQGDYVYVVVADQKAELRNVRTGPTLGDVTVVEQGLEVDATVVTEGQLRVAPGVSLTILPDKSADGQDAP